MLCYEAILLQIGGTNAVIFGKPFLSANQQATRNSLTLLCMNLKGLPLSPVPILFLFIYIMYIIWMWKYTILTGY